MCRGCALWERKVHGQKKDNDRNGLETDET
jgi:hypothetical protein